MSPTTHEALSILAIDIGTVHTRAFLFDVVEESYHFIASGVTSTTLEPPFRDITVGIMSAINQLQEVTGRVLLNQKTNLIIPSQVGGEGVDQFFVTFSAGANLKIATFGLMNDVSLQSINKVAATTYGTVVESISISDNRSIHDQIDDVLQVKPDLILFAGGADRGATRSVRKIADLIAAILQLTPQEQRPPVVYSGNQSLVKPISEMLGHYTKVAGTVNIRPEMDSEELDQVSEELAAIVTNIRSSQIDGLGRLAPLCNDTPTPSATASGRIARFLSQAGDPEKGVLAIDLGAGSTSVASARNGKLDLKIFPVGSAQGFERFLNATPFSEISQWLPAEISREDALDQLWQKTLFPGIIPITQEALMIDQAATRQILRYVMREIAARGALQDNGYETILLGGSALTQASSPAQSLLMLLDGLQPRGISTFILDSHAILPALGAAARITPLLPVQVLETTAFTNLATVISLDSPAKAGVIILRARLQLSNGKSAEIEVKQGSLVALPLKIGENAVLELQPMHQTQVESAELTDTTIKVKGGLCGLVIDARGRPLKLPSDAARRSELLKRWSSVFDQV